MPTYTEEYSKPRVLRLRNRVYAHFSPRIYGPLKAACIREF